MHGQRERCGHVRDRAGAEEPPRQPSEGHPPKVKPKEGVRTERCVFRKDRYCIANAFLTLLRMCSLILWLRNLASLETD